MCHVFHVLIGIYCSVFYMFYVNIDMYKISIYSFLLIAIMCFLVHIYL